ncbi:MAG TPA: DUF1598 domain-containing protein [Pirellulaceae bacterium]|jgi:hypothetical protein|nr:DUF1598 domain-containing protein [Pirellulaceae bacterium]
MIAFGLRPRFFAPIARSVFAAAAAATLLGAFGTFGFAQERTDVGTGRAKLDAYLESGEYPLALNVAASLDDPAERDAALIAIARSQARAGMSEQAAQTLAQVQSAAALSQIAASAQESASPSTNGPSTNGPTPAAGAAGGGSLADFDTLIELITSTVDPESWPEFGGTGAASIRGFPTGVYVDAAGALKRIEPSAADDLEALRLSSRTADDVVGPTDESPLRKVSLKALERALALDAVRGQAPSADAMSLGGLYRIDYVFLYPESGDVVIAGPAGPLTRDADDRLVHAATGTPALRLDDLVVCLRHAYSAEGDFGCAITPTEASLARAQEYLAANARRSLGSDAARRRWLGGLRESLGPQEISVFGIDPRTHAGRVMVVADWHMKRIGVGLEPGVANVTSYLDLLAETGKAPPSIQTLRWWFAVREDAVRTNAARDAFAFEGIGVQVLSENQLLARTGERTPTGESDLLNSQFAESFTKEYAALATKYPVYAELKNVFDLALVAAIARQADKDGTGPTRLPYLLGTDETRSYRVPLEAAPATVDSIVNDRKLKNGTVLAAVSGGVSVRAQDRLSAALVGARADASAARVERAEADQTLTAERWWWD